MVVASLVAPAPNVAVLPVPAQLVVAMAAVVEAARCVVHTARTSVEAARTLVVGAKPLAVAWANRSLAVVETLRRALPVAWEGTLAAGAN